MPSKLWGGGPYKTNNGPVPPLGMSVHKIKPRGGRKREVPRVRHTVLPSSKAKRSYRVGGTKRGCTG